MLRNTLFQFVKKNKELVFSFGLFSTAVGLQVLENRDVKNGKKEPRPLPADVEDQLLYEGKGQGTTYFYTATGYPVHNSRMSSKERKALQEKWTKEKTDRLEKERIEQDWKEHLELKKKPYSNKR